jgi:outer membrane receptor protein involved in Fe transport
MRLKLFLLLLLSVTIPSLAQTASVTGRVVDADTGNPVSGATVTLGDRGINVTTGIAGDFSISKTLPGAYVLIINANGYASGSRAVELYNNQTVDAGVIRLYNELSSGDYYEENQDMLFDESVLEDEEGNSQALSALTGASDDVYYSTASYNFGPMYFRYRGYNSEYQQVYINGVSFNDLIRGRFNFSTLMGLTSRAFRNKTTTLGLGAAEYGFGDVGGSVNYNTAASSYAAGFNGSLAYTNANYMFRAMASYSTGLNAKGWAFTVAGIGRYADEGVVEGTFYNSGGLFMTLEKVLNKNHSLMLTAFGGPTQRANSSATYQEAYDLAGSNLYNPNWGWQNGEKRAARIVESFDPTVMLNWLYKDQKTQLNTALTARWVNYSSSALNWYNANDPNPTYYRYLPSYFLDDDGNATETSELYTRLWTQNSQFRQINWDNLYQTNYLNNEANKSLPDDQKVGASYIQEARHSNQFNALFNSYINHRLNDVMALQAGVSFNYTRASFYKTIRDLLGGEFWIDIDPFSDREITLDPDLLQNDLDNPNRRVYKGDRFGYDYNIDAIQATAWLQNTINLPRWDVNYGMKVSYTQYQRDGKMRNGRAPGNSLGKGTIHRFDNAALKAGATYKVDGHNFIMAHASYETRAPLVDNIYISPRVKDTTVDNPESERILSVDATYGWNYRRFRGSLSAFYTDMSDMTERTSFYDDRYSTYTNFVLSGVKKVYKGLELGAAYRITPAWTATVAATYARYQYKNNPKGTRSVENGMLADTTQTVYLKNFYVGSTPQYAANIGIDWAAPKNWYFNINATWQGDAYVNLSPLYHEAISDLYTAWPGAATAPDEEKWLKEKISELSTQDKLKNAFTVNLSIGKSLYINRKVGLNFNLSVNNLLNNKDVVTYAYQQSRMDVTDYNRTKYPNRYLYAQGIKVFFNVGVRF